MKNRCICGCGRAFGLIRYGKFATKECQLRHEREKRRKLQERKRLLEFQSWLFKRHPP